MDRETWERFIQEHPDWNLYPSPPDERDYPLQAIGIDTTIPVQKRVMLPDPPFILDQGNTPECVGATGTGILNAYFDRKGTLPPGGLSMSYLYHRCKQEDEIPDVDGTYPRIALKIMQKEGVCSERLYPFNSKLSITPEMRQEALNYRIKAYARLYGLEQVKQALSQGKYVFIGTIVTKTNWHDNTKEGGFLGLPEGAILGGHATWLKGYDDNLGFRAFMGYLRGVNSWGESWGDKGSYWMPYEYVSWRLLDLPDFQAFQEAWAVEFDEPAKQEKVIEMQVGNKEAVVDGQNVVLDQEPVINPQTSRTLVPLRFIAEQMGADVGWDAKTQEIRIIMG